MFSIDSRIAALLVLTIPSFPAHGHAIGPVGGEALAWQNEYVSQVVGGGSWQYTHPGDIDVEGKNCVHGRSLHFNVRDEYAFDIDETVQLEIQFYLGSGTTREATVIYERSDAAPPYKLGTLLGVDPETRQTIKLSRSSESAWRTYTLALERARFANGDFSGTDFSIDGDQEELVVCGIVLKRSYTTRLPSAFGNAAIEVVDEQGKPTPVRMGLYDQAGRLPLPGPDAIPLRTFNGFSRIVAVRLGAKRWPAKNRSVFYIDGHYRPTLPPGDYEVIVSKGPEYRVVRQRFTIRPNRTTTLKIHLHRWVSMAAEGWYSGDDHIHYTRESANDDHSLLTFTEAEGLNVGNILQMGNSGAVHFQQYAWQQVANSDQSTFVLVPGQEDPRTTRHGHTIQLNLKAPVRDPTHYLLYDDVFAEVRAQGGVTGYAHAFGDEGGSGAQAGLPLDVAFGLVDFVEVLQLGTAAGKLWFDFLNLGYKLSPAAGTDYPYADIPGAERSYVYLDSRFTPQAWFDGLKAGRTFVTSGPLLQFTVNRRAMGSELSVKSGDMLKIQATARLNPDVDNLDRLELIEQGKVIKTVRASPDATSVSLEYEIPANHGSWFVVRCFGKQQDRAANVVALSAPVYVHVDGQSFWKPTAVPEIVARFKKNMQSIVTAGAESDEAWDTHDPNAKYWDAQKPLLEQRIARATALYDELARRANEVSH